MQTTLYNQKGEKIGSYDLPDKIFNIKMNSDLVHQVFLAQRSNARIPIAHTKTRGEVAGGGIKPWRQKGTGRARHGSIRSPLWRHGGTVFGPRKERSYFQKINKKMKRKALFMVLSGKVSDNEFIVVDELKIEAPKTKEMALIIKNFFKDNKKKRPKILIALTEDGANIIRSARNLENVKVLDARNLNVNDLLSYKYLLIPKDSVELIKKQFI